MRKLFEAESSKQKGTRYAYRSIFLCQNGTYTVHAIFPILVCVALRQLTQFGECLNVDNVHVG